MHKPIGKGIVEVFRRQGMEVYTVPAAETCALRKMPCLMAREVAAFNALIAEHGVS